MNSGKLPNFLIVGAARSGTTSLYNYLIQHPEIFMSAVKEPHFITGQFLKFPHTGKDDEILDTHRIKDFHQYRGLFNSAHKEKAIGEASADMLFHHAQAIPAIKEILGDVKIIILLREPVERAFSNYWFLRRLDRESLTFEDALAAEEYRITKNYEFIWFYKRNSLYFEAVQSYINAFTEVGIYFYDDLRLDAKRTVQRVYEFIGVEPEFQPKVGTCYNASGEPTNRLVYSLLTRSNPVKVLLRPLVNLVYPKEKRMHLIEKWKSNLVEKPAMREETRRMLQKLYRDDIIELQEVLGRDLSDWIE